MVVAHQLSSNSSNTSIAKSPEKPQPMDVQSMAPPPFLIKTYDMVDDPSTDSIVSWNAGGNGFVVWNSNEFQKEMLPKFFKHNNFSSFVRQLNTYGFRKVDPDRWEFANEGFLKGQKQLLRGIHRRKPASHTHQQQVQAAQPQSKPACVEVGKFGIEGEIDRLKRDKNVLMAELVRLRQHQQQTDRDLSMVLQRLHVTEQRQQQMISFLAKAMQSPSFLAQLVQQNENKKRLATARKKRRLPKRDNDTETVVVDEGSSSPVEGQIVKYQPNSNDPVSMFMQYLNSPAAELSAKMDLPNLEVTFRDLDGKQEGGGGGAGGFALAGMHSARMMGDLSPSRLMKDMADSLSLSDAEMQVAPASPLSLMRFENLEDGGDSSLGIEQQQGEGEGDGEGGGDEGNSLLEDMATADDFEWDQFLIQAGVDIDAADGELPLWDENGDNVDELTQQIQQL